jgi:hypothetical protein
MAAGDGLVSMAPTSIAYSGTSAGINADGGVDFSAVTSLSLNGVFTSDYDNYLIVANHYPASSGMNIQIRWRASGTDNSTASSYTLQYMVASGSDPIYAGRSSEDKGYFSFTAATGAGRNGNHTHVYGPCLAQPTAWRTVTASSWNTAETSDLANTHNQSTSYDGFTIYVASSSITGNIHVFGYEE